MATYLVTGATGMLGRELVPLLLQDTDAHLRLLVHQEGRALSATGLLRRYGVDDVSARRRVRLVRGDVTLRDLGISASDRRALAGSVTGILHAAAATRFDLPLAAARRANVRGTENVLRFAGGCDALDRIALVSTVYVSGRRRGRILETEREHAAGFVNTYERSKYEAEDVALAAGLPVSVYRLSTLLGSAEDGATARVAMPHLAMRLVYLGLAPIVPGEPSCTVDLLPTDVAARTIARLFAHRFAAGQVFHVVAGEGKSFNLAQVIDATWEALADAEPDWRRRARPRPVICDEAAFAQALRAARLTRNMVLLRAFDTIAKFCGQFSLPKTFDARCLAEALPDHFARVPHPSAYFEKVVRYCVRERWGRVA